MAEDKKVVLKELSSDGNWYKRLFESSSDIVQRDTKPGHTVEQDLTAVENSLLKKVSGTAIVYKSLNEINDTLSIADDMVDICGAMAAGSIALYGNISGTTSIYPTDNGTVLILKYSEEYCMCFYNDVETNKIYTGIYYNSASISAAKWSGWSTYAATNHTHSAATSTVLGMVKSGGDVTIDSNGIITVKDDSHAHTIANVDGLQSELNDLTAAVEAAANSITSHTGDKNNPHGVSVTQIGAIPESKIGTANGIASLDSSGKVLSSQLPSYVDDVLEFSTKAQFPSQGESGKIYVDISTNKTYRWTGTTYIEISASIALGETSSTAYRGDRGKIAYDHSQLTSGNPHGVTKSDVGLGNVGNYKALSTVSGQGLSTTEISNVLSNLGIIASIAEINYLDGATDNIQTQLDNRLQLAPTENIPSGSDLDTYTDIGVFTIGSGSVSNSITNTAIPDVGYMLIVCSPYGINSSSRTQYAVSSTGIIRFRTYSSSSWSDWGDVFTTRNKPSATQIIEDSSHRFVTDSEKTTWNNSVDSIGKYYPTSNSSADGILDTSIDTTLIVGVSSTVNSEIYNLFDKAISFVFCLQLFYSTISATTTRSQIIIASDGRIASRYCVGTSGTWSSWRRYADSVHTHDISDVASLSTTLSQKQDTITGAATTILTSNLTASRALVSNSSGKVAVSAVTATELGYLDGVTSKIQTQLNGKAASSHDHDGTYVRMVDQSSQPTNQSTGDLWLCPV